MSKTAPPDRDTTSGDTAAEAGPSDASSPRDWKTSVAAVTSTVADAAIEAVTVVGDAARSLTARARSEQPTNGDGAGATTAPAAPPADAADTPPRATREAHGAAGAITARAATIKRRLAGRQRDGTPAAGAETAPLGDTPTSPSPSNGSATTPPVAPLEEAPTSPPPSNGGATTPPVDAPSTAPPSNGRRVAPRTTDATPSRRSRTGPPQERRGTPDARSNGVAPPGSRPADRAAGAGAAAFSEDGAWGFRKGTDEREPAWLPPLRQRPDEQRPWLVRAATFALATLAGLAAIAVIGLALLPRAFALAAESTSAELILPEDTEFDPLASRSRVMYSDGSLLAILHGEQDRNPVSLDKIPDHAWQAIVAEEDRKFFEHDGYDPAGIGRALVANFQAGGVRQGGSTITQQVARMNFEEVGTDESLERKVKEVIYAMALERKFSKEEILDRYVNQVYFGAGTYGLQAASEEFFDTNIREIEVDQAALLAGLISSPSAYNPRDYPDRAKRQRDLVLRNMSIAGYISESEAARYQQEPLDIAEPSGSTNRQPSIVEAIIREFKRNPLFGATEQEREDALFNGGLRITTTINPKLQKLAQRVVDDNFSNDGPTAAIASVNPRSGAIIAAASSKRNNRDNFSLALQGRRQPGSAFKPFVMAEALRQGFSPGTTLDAKSPLVLPQPGTDWTVQNYGGASYGPLDMRTATAKSVNTYYAQLMELVGADETVDLVEKMGVNRRAAFGENAFPAIVLGGLEFGTTPMEMASAYGTFAYNGVHVDAHLLEEVRRGKEVLLEAQPQKVQVLEPGVNAAALEILKAPVSSGGTAPMSIPGFPVAGKTGTTQLATDAWFVGTTPVMSTAVWVGHPQAQTRMYGATGGSLAAPIWRAYMTEALDGRKPRDFPEAEDAEFIGKAIKVPKVQGLTAQDAMSKLAKVKLIGQVQYQPHATVPAGVVIWASPSDEAQRGTTVYVGVSSGQPPPEPDPEPRSGRGSDGDDDDDSGDGNAGNGNGNGGRGQGNGGNGNGNGGDDD
ncbi:MAG TPA: transglycosylase domain-containing protein [Euzebyales bacterium]|nr:transglycosylase domain-containing protein [Euzebyales bacterium]